MNIAKNKKLAFSLIELSIVVLIIGILIAGVTQGSRLVRQSRIKMAQNLTRSTSVNSIPNLMVWLEPTLDNSIISATNNNAPEDGDSVLSWNDINVQSTDLISLSQLIPALQPEYVINSINNLPAVRFTASSSTILYSNRAPLPAGSSNYTLVAVWQANLINSVARIIASQGPSSVTTNQSASILIQNNNTYGFHGGGNNYNPYVPKVSTPYITVIVVNNNLSNNISLYTNSNTPMVGATNAPSSLYLSAARFTVGAVSYNSNYFDGWVSEVMFFNRALKSSEVTDINQYLSKKYAITLVN